MLLLLLLVLLLLFPRPPLWYLWCVVVAATNAAVSGTAAIVANAAENFIFNADSNAVCNAVPQCFQCYFNVAWNVGCNAVSLFVHADFNAVPKAFYDCTCVI